MHLCRLRGGGQGDADVPVWVRGGRPGGEVPAPVRLRRRPVGDAWPGGWIVVGPSALPFIPSYPTPHELSEEELDWLAGQYVDAAHRALSAGFDIVENHMAHG